jgi:hypothetical protein
VPEYVILDSPYSSKENEVKDSTAVNKSKIGGPQKRRSSSLNDLSKIHNTNLFTTQSNRQHAKKTGSVFPQPGAKLADNKLSIQGKSFLFKVPNDPRVVPLVESMNKHSIMNNEKRPVVLVNINKDEKANVNQNKKRFENIAVLNKNIFEFSELKGIRRRNPIENRNSLNQHEDTLKEDTEFNSSFIDKIIQKSIELKLKNYNEEYKDSVPKKSVEEDVDELIMEKHRSRSKGISIELFKFFRRKHYL